MHCKLLNGPSFPALQCSYQTNVEQGDGDEEGEVEEPDEAAAGEHEDEGEDGERPPRARGRREVGAREARHLVRVAEVGEGEAGTGEVHHQREQRHQQPRHASPPLRRGLGQ